VFLEWVRSGSSESHNSRIHSIASVLAHFRSKLARGWFQLGFKGGAFKRNAGFSTGSFMTHLEKPRTFLEITRPIFSVFGLIKRNCELEAENLHRRARGFLCMRQLLK
jgi:hypothetical protein